MHSGTRTRRVSHELVVCIYVSGPLSREGRIWCAVYGHIQQRHIYPGLVESSIRVYIYGTRTYTHMTCRERKGSMCVYIYGTRTYMHYPESGTYGVPYMETYMYVYYICMRDIYGTPTLQVYICLRPLDALNAAAYILITCIDVSFVGLYT